MRVLLTTLGSHGDIHPFIALAQEFSRRGHEAVLATNPAFAAQGERAGVNMAALTEHADLKDIMTNYAVMDHRRGARVVLKELTIPLVPKIYEHAAQLIREFKPDVLLNHPICLGAPWAAERAGVPVVTVSLAPINWMRSHDPIVFGRWRSHNPRVYATRFDAWVGKHLIRLMLDGPLNRIRRELGLPKTRDMLVGEMTRPGLNLGLWHEAFRRAAKGDPEGSRICGWAWFDTHHDHEHDPQPLERFLSEGAAPIVFTLGSAAVHSPGGFFHAAIEAARLVGRRAVLLVGRAEYVSALPKLPKSVGAFTYAPFSTLLPRGCASVHHGGIGSTGQALRAGKPSLVVPMAHDQFDNAARCKRLGVSQTLPHKDITAEKLARALRVILDDPAVGERAKNLGAKIDAPSGAITAVSEVERVFNSASRAGQR
jgi:rhamnosyltransferase subunit B